MMVSFIGCGHNDNVTIENARKGESIFISSGCTKCHSVTGETTYGPPLIFGFNKQINVVRNGKTLTIKLDRNYIVRSMKLPDYEKLEGYESKIMAQINLSSDDINHIADYLIYINTKKTDPLELK
jgi:cytochrome c553